MAKEKIWPHPLAPVWLNLGDPQRHTIGISHFFVCLFNGWQCTWIISKHSTLMLYDHWRHQNGQRKDLASYISTSMAKLRRAPGTSNNCQQFLCLPVSRLAMHLDHLKPSHLNALGPLEPLEWPKKRFGLIHQHQYGLTQETPRDIQLELAISLFACSKAGNALGSSQNIPP